MFSRDSFSDVVWRENKPAHRVPPALLLAFCSLFATLHEGNCSPEKMVRTHQNLSKIQMGRKKRENGKARNVDKNKIL